MLNIEKNATQAHQYLATGGFAGSLSGQKCTMIPMNQIIEMNINKSSKVVRNLSGVTFSMQVKVGCGSIIFWLF